MSGYAFTPIKREPESAEFRFAPLSDEGDNGEFTFTPLEAGRPSTLRNVALNNPLTAIGETALNLATTGVAMPVAGLAGLATAAGNALGLTKKTGADVVHAVGDALTYQPRGEMGQAATQAVMYPFEKLHEGATYVGNKTQDATGSPGAATAAHTLIEGVLPLAAFPAARAGRAKLQERAAAAEAPKATAPEAAGEFKFTPIEEVSHETAKPVQAREGRLAGSDPQVHGAEAAKLEALRRHGDNSLPGMDAELPAIPPGHGPGADANALARTAGHNEGVLPRELRMDNPDAAAEPARVLSEGEGRRAGIDGGAGSEIAGAAEPEFGAVPAYERAAARSAGKETLPQVDLADVQRRNTPVADVGEAGGPAALRPMGSPDPIRHATGAGIDAGTVQQPRQARWALVEARDLKPQDKYARPDWYAREKATQEIIGEFDPARLVAALDDADGAPIVGRDGTVEAGHKRAEAIQRVYQANGAKAESYRQTLREQAPVLGLDLTAVDQMKKPVLVRVPDEPAPRLASSSPAADKAASQWLPFPPETQTLGIPRAEMPQIKGEHRGAFIQFLSGKGVTRKNIEVPAASIKPTQAEYSPGKVTGWAKAGDSDRSVLVSSDGYVLDGHHQWLASHAAGEPVKAIRLDAPIRDLLKLSDEFPSVKRAAGTTKAQDMAAGVQNGTWNPGANYAPFVDQVRAPEAKAASVADLPTPIRRESIIKDFADALGATVYEGRVKGKRRLGFFRPKNEETRIKNAADIEVAAHEMAHLIDSRVPELSKAWRSDKALREELKSVSYDQKSVTEGFAEGVRLWMTQPETLEARAPKVAAWLDDFASGNKEYGPAMRKAQERMTAWFGQDALNRARSKIGTEKPLAEYFDRAFDKFRQATVDDLHGIMQMERDLTGKLSSVGPYESARLSRSAASMADGAVRFGHPVKLPDGSHKFAGKGLEEILKPVAESLDDALLYFVGRSANELMGQKREHLFTKGEIGAMLKLKTPERAKAFEDYQAWNRGILDFAEANGIINPDSRALWQRTQYLPFHRVEQPGGIKGKPGDWAGVQALTGGTTNLRDILGNVIGNAAMLLDKAAKNEARLKVADLADKTKAGKWMVKIEAGERPVKISGDQVLDAMLKRYGIAVDGDAPAFFQFLLKGQPPAGNNVVAVLRHGKPEWYEVGDPILYRALLAVDRPVQNWLVRMLGAPKRIGQASITLTPDFWLANMARDTLMGSVMSRAGFRPILDSLQGMRLRMTNDPLYQDFIANGGGLSSIYLDEGAVRAKLHRFYQKQGIDVKTVLDTPEKLLNAVETLGDAFEMSTRLGEYRRAIQRGEHPRHAAYLGREVSTDFAMRGDNKTIGFLYDTVMFLKAATVSWDRLGRGVTIDPNKGAIAAKTAAIAGMSAALYLLNRDDPRYADLPDWNRDSNWHIFVGEHHFRYPKIWEIGAVASMAERSTEKLMAEDPEGLGKDFARILGNTFHVNLMPQVIAPLYEQAANRNNFTKAPIETPGMEGVQPFLRSKPGTSETFKALGMATQDNPEWAQVNPARAEALVRGYFNTWGLYGLMLTDQAFFGDKLPEKRADELPVVRRFYASEPAKHTKYESEFYDILSEARRLRGTMRELDELGMREVADSKENSPLAGEAKPLERAQKNLGAINRDMQAARRDPILTPKQKREKLDSLTVERNSLLKAAVQDSKAAQKINTKPPTAAEMARRGINQEE